MHARIYAPDFSAVSGKSEKIFLVQAEIVGRWMCDYFRSIMTPSRLAAKILAQYTGRVKWTLFQVILSNSYQLSNFNDI